jgi:hypothetical protein
MAIEVLREENHALECCVASADELHETVVCLEAEWRSKRRVRSAKHGEPPPVLFSLLFVFLHFDTNFVETTLEGLMLDLNCWPTFA